MKKLIHYCAGVLISILCVAFVGCNELDNLKQQEQEQPEAPKQKEETDPFLGQEIPGMETYQATGTVIGSFADTGFGSFLVQVDEKYLIGKIFEFYDDRWIPAKMPQYGTYENMIQVQNKLPVKVGDRISFSYREWQMEKDRDLFLIGDGTVMADHVSPQVPTLVITKYKIIITSNTNAL